MIWAEFELRSLKVETLSLLSYMWVEHPRLQPVLVSIIFHFSSSVRCEELILAPLWLVHVQHLSVQYPVNLSTSSYGFHLHR